MYSRTDIVELCLHYKGYTQVNHPEYRPAVRIPDRKCMYLNQQKTMTWQDKVYKKMMPESAYYMCLLDKEYRKRYQLIEIHLDYILHN